MAETIRSELYQAFKRSEDLARELSSMIERLRSDCELLPRHGELFYRAFHLFQDWYFQGIRNAFIWFEPKACYIEGSWYLPKHKVTVRIEPEGQLKLTAISPYPGCEEIWMKGREIEARLNSLLLELSNR